MESPFTSWKPVEVIDDKLESHGRTGVVKSAAPNEAGEVDVQLDGDKLDELTTFDVKSLRVL